MKIILIVSIFYVATFANAQMGKSPLPAYQDEPLQVQKELKAVAKKKTQSEIEEDIRSERAKKRKPDAEPDELANYIDQAEANEEESEE